MRPFHSVLEVYKTYLSRHKDKAIMISKTLEKVIEFYHKKYRQILVLSQKILKTKNSL